MLQSYGWILLLLTFIFIFVYKKRTKDSDAVTSKFEGHNLFKDLNEKNICIIEKALKKSGFKNIRHDLSKRRFYARTHSLCLLFQN
jgi:hypothetical protein